MGLNRIEEHSYYLKSHYSIIPGARQENFARQKADEKGAQSKTQVPRHLGNAISMVRTARARRHQKASIALVSQVENALHRLPGVQAYARHEAMRREDTGRCEPNGEHCPRQWLLGAHIALSCKSLYPWQPSLALKPASPASPVSPPPP